MNGYPAATKAARADIIETASGAGALSTLTAALTAAGLTETLKGPGPLTVFAPTNEAFGLLASGTGHAHAQDPFGQLTEVLKYHAVPGEVRAADLVEGQALMTLQGSELTVKVNGGQVTLIDAAGNSAHVITRDVAASNGVIHIIDALLFPTASTDTHEIPATPTQAGQPAEQGSDSFASMGAAFASESASRQRQTAKAPVRVLVGLTYVAMIAVNALANILPINGRTTGEISDSYENLFAPAGLTFSIWGVIYFLLGAHVLYQLGLFRGAELDAGPRTPGGPRVGGAHDVSPRAHLLQRVGVLFSVSSLVNVAWIFSWHYDLILVSMVLLATMLVFLILITRTIMGADLSTRDRLFVRLPFSVYFGWLTVATIANVTVWLVSIGWDGFGIAESTWAVIIMSVGVIIGTAVTLKDRDVAYGLVLAWAYFGIWIKHTSESGFNGAYPVVLATALLGVAAFVVAGAVALRTTEPAPRSDPASSKH